MSECEFAEEAHPAISSKNDRVAYYLVEDNIHPYCKGNG